MIFKNIPHMLLNILQILGMYTNLCYVRSQITLRKKDTDLWPNLLLVWM